MASRWYCRIGRQQFGPLTSNQLKRMAQRGQLTPDSPVRCGDDGRWIKASQIKGLLGATTADSSDSADSSSQTQLPRAKPLSERTSASNRDTSSRKSRRRKIHARRPVAPPPIDTTPQEIPVGRVASTTPQPFVAVNTSDSDMSGACEAAAPARKRVGAKKITVWLALCVVGLGVVGGAAMLARPLLLADSAAQPAATIAESPTKVEDAMKAAAVEVDPAPLAQQSEPAPPASPPAEVAASRRLVRSVRAWRDPRKRIRFGDARLSVSAIWLGSDLSGESQQPPVESAQSDSFSSAGSAEAEGAKSQQGQPGHVGDDHRPQYLFVAIRLENTSGVKPLAYEGWNGAQNPDYGAVLVDDQERDYPRVPLSAAPAQERIATAHLEPGETVTDVLVFQAPAEGFELLRLALPYGAIHPQSGCFGFEIEQYMVSAGFANQPDEPTDLGIRKADSADEGAEAKSGPPSIKDLNRMLERADKQYQEMKEKEPQPESDKPANPPPGHGDKPSPAVDAAQQS